MTTKCLIKKALISNPQQRVIDAFIRQLVRMKLNLSKYLSVMNTDTFILYRTYSEWTLHRFDQPKP